MEMIEDQPNSIENIPMIIGYNSIEGLVGLIDCQKNQNYQSIDKDLARYIPKTIDLGSDNPKYAEFANAIREFYFSGRNVSDQTKVELINLMSDYHFNMESHFVAEAYARRQHRYSKFGDNMYCVKKKIENI